MIGVTFLLMIAGIVGSGPWLTSRVAGVVARAGRRAPSLLAARRLEDNPSAAFRAISGIVIAVFVGTVFSGIAASILARDVLLDDGMASHVVAAGTREAIPPAAADPPPAPTPPPTIPADDLAALVGDLRALPGVRDVVEVHALPDDPELREALARTPEGLNPTATLARCDDAVGMGFDGCDGTTQLNVSAYGVSAAEQSVPIPEVRLDTLPVTALVVITDGRTATIEQARTVLESGIPGRGRSPGPTWRPARRTRCARRSGSPTWPWP